MKPYSNKRFFWKKYATFVKIEPPIFSYYSSF